MAKSQAFSLLSLIIVLPFLSPGARCSTFTIINNCAYTVWPGILSGAGTPALSTTGFVLDSGKSSTLDVPSNWSGRLWGRTHCSTGPSNSTFSCAIGDCGSGKVECSGSGASRSVTLAEFTLDGSGGMDFFDVSLVDGYNLPILISPSAGSNTSSTGSCTATGCLVDLNDICPTDLRVILSDAGGQSAACRSACEAFGKPEFCCTGTYGNPDTCKPSSYSEFFKTACPRAYSFAYDDSSSTFTCITGINYVITFCPSISSQKAGENKPQAAAVPLIDNTMVFLGPASLGAAKTSRQLAPAAAGAGLAAFLLLI